MKNHHLPLLTMKNQIEFYKIPNSTSNRIYEYIQRNLVFFLFFLSCLQIIYTGRIQYCQKLESKAGNCRDREVEEKLGYMHA